MSDSRKLNPYDEFPYESFPFPQAHPRRLATIAKLFGMTPARLDACRVLELGCSNGGHLLPFAQDFPDSEAIGVDGANRQILIGQQALQAAGLRNAQLLHRNVLEIDERLGTFDYIIVHGVYSWVSTDVQEKILSICKNNLREQGIAYVSYNTNPGWRLRGMIRDLMTFRARFFDRPERQLSEGRALLDFLADSVPTKDNAYGILLRNELDGLRSKEDWYLLHEYLEDENRPEYFYQFMKRAAAKDLQYLGEADFSTMSAANFPPKVEEKLRQLASDVVQTEQYMDFVRNRFFRQTLLCHADVQLDRAIPPERAYDLFVASSTEPADGPIDPRNRDRVVFRRQGSTLTTTEPLVKAAMLHLKSIWPSSISFQELLIAARGRINPGASVLNAEQAAKDAKILAGPIIRCYATTHVDLSVHRDHFTLEIADRPLTTPLIRHQAATNQRATNLAHESVRLTDVQSEILKHLDGKTDHQLVIQALSQQVNNGKLVVNDAGRPVNDRNRIHAILTNVLAENLTAISRKALLLADVR